MIVKTGKIKPQIKWTPERIQFLKDTYPLQGAGPAVKELELSAEAVKSAASRWGIKSLVDKNHYKLKPLMEETPTNLYWWGFLMADGHLDEEGELKLSSAVKDLGHISKLANILNCNVHTRQVVTSYGPGEYCGFTCKDIKYGVELKNRLNITNNKTYNAPLLTFLDTQEKFLAFLAGFIDGDGMIGYKTSRPYLLRISCHYNWKPNLEYFKDKLQEYFGFSVTVGITKRGYSYLSMSTSKQIIQLKEEFLKLQLPIMKRKWEHIQK